MRRKWWFLLYIQEGDYGLIRAEFSRAREKKEDDDARRCFVGKVERWFIYNVCKERKTAMAARAYSYLHFPASLLSPAFFWHNRTEGAGRGYAIRKCPPYFTYRSEDTRRGVRLANRARVLHRRKKKERKKGTGIFFPLDPRIFLIFWNL